MPIAESLLRQAALTCFANARDIYKEACLLFEHGYYTRAAALAVIGSEEFAKSIIYTIGVFRPDQHEQLSNALRKGKSGGELFFHEVKHSIDAEVEGIQIETSEGMDCLESEIGISIGYDERFHALLDSLIRYGLDRLLPSKNDAKLYAKSLNEIYHGAAPNTLKEMAFYVDADIDGNGGIGTPARVGEREARWAIQGLEWSLDTFDRLPTYLQVKHIEKKDGEPF